MHEDKVFGQAGGYYVQHKVSLKYEKCEVFTTTIRGK